ncbi:PIN domain-containing protein [Streptomyces sp. NBC_01092]|uniref:PIN domain-containing protein n=1 Tax=Streptomyces sp. NBC_01092 TaxID=2903748 RepID=UPI0038660D0F|nr:PIN domain-containing protein [Streptomyces sp. NBC_01092]
MLVSPLPGVDRKHLHRTLGEVCQKVSNLYTSGPHEYYERLLAYLDWATDAVERLDSLISSADIDRLVLTKRYDQLLAGLDNFTVGSTQRLVNQLVSAELRQRTTVFTAAVETLAQELQRWQLRGMPVVADSSFYVHHSYKLEETDFAELLGITEHPVHLLVPMVVVDELDQLKESKAPQARWRARYTLAVLDQLFQKSTDHAVLRRADAEVQRNTGVRRGEVTVQLLFDPPGHVRLPINDDEIVDRALAIKPLSGREVTVLTYDTGQATRARAAGLRDVKLSMPVDDEPERQTTNKRKTPSSKRGVQAPKESTITR